MQRVNEWYSKCASLCSRVFLHTYRQELRARFLDKPWLDVLSKGDLLQEQFQQADDAASASPQAILSSGHDTDVSTAVEWALAVPDALRVSSLTGEGVEELRAALEAMALDWTMRQEVEEAAAQDSA